MLNSMSTVSSGTPTQSKYSPPILNSSKLNGDFVYICVYRAFVTWNEKFVHVWNPNTRQLLYSVDVYQETKSHVNSTLCYSVKNFVSLA